MKPKQIFYRFYYPLKKHFFKSAIIKEYHIQSSNLHPEILFPHYSIDDKLVEESTQTFNFLNRAYTFNDRIEWTFNEYGTLWSFNLHYYSWLSDDKISVEFRLDTINQVIDNQNKNEIFANSYTASLRIVNWIKFLLQYHIKDNKIKANLYQQSHRLNEFPEYHIMGNYLLENGIALVWAGVYFNDASFRQLGEQIVTKELDEQILNDGSHFEKSVSYHSNILRRLLDLTLFYDTIIGDDTLYNYLIIKSSQMLSHLFVLNSSNYFPPHFGDSNERLLVNFCELQNVAQNLRLDTNDCALNECGIRKLQRDQVVVFFNMGNVPAAYQPGHSHADALSFTLNIDNLPIIVDRGTSIYEQSEQRLMERSTSAHNTISVNGENSSDVWAAFRMGKRPSIIVHKDDEAVIDCSHNGFEKLNITHRRKINILNKEIVISDLLEGWSGQQAFSYLHFYPETIIEISDYKEFVTINRSLCLNVEGADFYLEEYEYCEGFNQTKVAMRLVFKIKNRNISIKIKVLDG